MYFVKLIMVKEMCVMRKFYTCSTKLFVKQDVGKTGLVLFPVLTTSHFTDNFLLQIEEKGQEGMVLDGFLTKNTGLVVFV